MFKPLNPADVSSTDSDMVLAFLNGARDVQEIADAVELPQQPDIGLKLAQRLLLQRQRLGGAFESLEQVLDTPLIGPQRFTQIVITLSSARAQMLETIDSDLRDDLEALRDQLVRLVRDTSKGAALRMDLTGEGAWHGQSMNVLVQVDGPDGLPFVAAPINFVCINGVISRSGRDRSDDGVNLATHTDGNGLVELTVCTGSTQAPDPNAALALDRALATLTLDAPNPAAIESQLDQLTELYRSAGGTGFRRAVDHRFRQEIESGNAVATAQWNYRSCTLIGMVAAADAGQPAVVAQLTLRCKDWIPPWLDNLRHAVSGSQLIDAQLAKVPATVSDSGALMSYLLNVFDAYGNDEPGLAARVFQDSTTQERIRNYINDNTANLDVATLKSLLPNAARSEQILKSSGGAVLAAVESSKEQIKVDIGKSLPFDPGTLADRLGELERSKVVTGDLDRLREQFDTDLATTRTTLGTLIDSKANLTEIDDLRINVTRIDSEGRVLKSLTDRINADVADLKSRGP